MPTAETWLTPRPGGKDFCKTAVGMEPARAGCEQRRGRGRIRIGRALGAGAARDSARFTTATSPYPGGAQPACERKARGLTKKDRALPTASPHAGAGPPSTQHTRRTQWGPSQICTCVSFSHSPNRRPAAGRPPLPAAGRRRQHCLPAPNILWAVPVQGGGRRRWGITTRLATASKPPPLAAAAIAATSAAASVPLCCSRCGRPHVPRHDAPTGQAAFLK